MFRFFSGKAALGLILFFSCIGAGLAGREPAPATMNPITDYTDLAAAPEQVALGGLKIRLEAEVLQASDPIAFIIKITAQSASPEPWPGQVHKIVHILSGGKAYEAELIQPFPSGPQGTDLIAATTANPDLTPSPPLDLVVKLSTDNGKNYLLRAGSDQIRWRNPIEYLDYAAGNFTGTVKAPGRLSSHDLIPIQHDFSGGSSTLAALLKFAFDEDVTEKTVMNGMLTHGDRGLIMARNSFSLLDMKAYLKSMGYQSAGFKETDAISYRTFTENGLQTMLPAIISIDFNGFKHFALLRGFDENRVYIGDPAMGNLSMSFTELNAVMVRLTSGQWMVFVVRKTDLT